MPNRSDVLEHVGHDIALAVAEAGLQRVRVEALRVPAVELADLLGELGLLQQNQLVDEFALGLGHDKAAQLLLREVQRGAVRLPSA